MGAQQFGPHLLTTPLAVQHPNIVAYQLGVFTYGQHACGFVVGVIWAQRACWADVQTPAEHLPLMQASSALQHNVLPQHC